MTAPARPTRRTTTPVPHRAASTVLTLVVPAVLLLAATAVAFAWRDRLPDPVASHWGPDGVDGTSSFAGLLAVLPAVGVPFAVLAWAIAVFAGRSALTRRFAAGLAVWVAGFAAALTLAMLAAQLDLPEAADAGDIGGGMALAFAVPLALAALAAWVTPGDAALPATAPVPASAARLPLPDGEVATWVRRIDWVHPGVVVAICAAFAAVMGLTTRTWWFAAVLFAFLATLVGGLSSWTVTVDARGLVARARLPRPRVVVPLAEVEHAEVVQVSPLREFGGWGLRMGIDGRVGVVLRGGEGLQVTRTGGRRVVVTVDDSATGAALLNTLAARTRA
ncbi:DUF1648 domain-containing protein [Actinotalea fermentans]|uniref:DUF1648 domain-containing protein n=1 Tax=Actinotalea fermentans TaxID=43671 RepID=A0A511YW55_9CELL|nr:DUF1648 domain-containing protein [Actinotalea fermentans]KGM17412.1 hypothetical protein N867_04015 [Actinotalea fermentans ATCC 43279 = JCM 9966 = DSM 3133]GEN79409.1 hypothetical protein AFE02nite_11430 [Actinotalea fermentans]